MTDVTIQLADKCGDLWEVPLPMRPSAVSDVILDNPAKGYYADIREEWRKAFCERLLMRGLQTLDDSDDHQFESLVLKDVLSLADLLGEIKSATV